MCIIAQLSDPSPILNYNMVSEPVRSTLCSPGCGFVVACGPLCVHPVVGGVCGVQACMGVVSPLGRSTLVASRAFVSGGGSGPI